MNTSSELGTIRMVHPLIPTTNLPDGDYSHFERKTHVPSTHAHLLPRGIMLPMWQCYNWELELNAKYLA